MEVWVECPACGRLWPVPDAPAAPACIACGASLACVACGDVAVHNHPPRGLLCEACFLRFVGIVEGYGYSIWNHRGAPWTAREDEVLRAGRAAGRPAREISLAILRTPAAVRSRAVALGLTRSRSRP